MRSTFENEEAADPLMLLWRLDQIATSRSDSAHLFADETVVEEEEDSGSDATECILWPDDSYFCRLL